MEEDPFPRPGDQLLHFTIEEELGHGTFARVYLARRRCSHRFVVLKMTTMRSDEPQKLARLQHANIVPSLVHAFAPIWKRSACPTSAHSHSLKSWHFPTTQGKPSRGIPVLLGKHLACRSDSLRTRSQMSHVESHGLWLVSQLASGLAHSHGRGILHRDLKPANILLTDDAVPMLLGFSTSRPNRRTPPRRADWVERSPTWLRSISRPSTAPR